MERFCAVIVTYGARYALLNQVIERLANSGVSAVVVVFNGNYVPTLVTAHPGVIPVPLPTNVGSAGGYRAGIEAALQLDADYFLLLDDDNLPASDCLNRLFSAHSMLGGDPLLAIQAFRPSQPWQRIVARDGTLTIGRPNTYGWFNFVNERHLLRRQLAFCDAKGWSKDNPSKAFVCLGVAAYGGLFISREALQLGELPDPRYFCYYDDLDFTDRLVRRGVMIRLCADALIEDIDTSWHATDKRVHPAFSPATDDLRIFLDLRNAFIFYRSRITNRAFYLLNGIGFWLGITYLVLFRSSNWRTTLRRLKIIVQAVRYGSRGEFAGLSAPTSP